MTSYLLVFAAFNICSIWELQVLFWDVLPVITAASLIIYIISILLADDDVTSGPHLGLIDTSLHLLIVFVMIPLSL